MSSPTATDHDQALHEAAAALSAAHDILQIEDVPAHLVAQAQHLVRLAQQAVDRAVFSDWG